MTCPDYRYPAEKFAMARRILMAPHPRGEADSFGHAFHECTLGLRNVNVESLDEDARGWVKTIRETMDTTGIVDREGRGTWFIKAETLSLEEDRNKFSTAVDALAYWFASEKN